jgi:pimeloyl-ACP methyl ester carboxylesterase
MLHSMHRVQAGDVELSVSDHGTGMPVLLVHGFPLDHGMWQLQIDALKSGCRVIAPDLRGFGRSAVTPGGVTMEQFADDLAAMLDSLGVREPVVFCGLSMGGYIAWQFWRRHRQRLRALVLCDTRAVADTPDGVQGRHALAEKVLAEGPQAAAAAMMPKLFGKRTAAEQPELIEAVRRMILASEPQGIAAALRGMAVRIDATPLLGQIDVPTLVLVGAEDAISSPSEMRGIADAIPGARFAEIPGAGHMAPMENPHAVNTALEQFVRQQAD